MSHQQYIPGSLELQAATLEEFLGLLETREQDAAIQSPVYSPLPRRAVCVEMLLDQSVSAENHSLPYRTRYVLTTFGYGCDLVSFRNVTSRSLEMGPPSEDSKKLRDRQVDAYERVKVAIEEKIRELGVGTHVSVIEGRLQTAASYGGPPSRGAPSSEGSS